ncbi:hypothetical protein ACFFMN_07325 [Planobispora siamensis]|uniref:Major Facilitator Superfamily protein n=1 Tax=Planobispora siamensis TaxID=936338 RepID=A0A8J3SIJ3_9ACTN|nr:hypothetical protein [Planobispora siamensis]GIH90298.1 hypothetical protein Psi01_09280 [Planobispora siamensis]
MAVPPMQPTQAVAAGSTAPSRSLRLSLLLDVVLGLLVVVALPLAIVAIPNTVSVVAALLPPGVSQIEMIRAHGLALPAMVLTVPLAAVAVRRLRAAPILVGGLALLAVADVAGGYADSPMVVALLRTLHGIGAGLLVPATLVAVWERPRILRAVWAGTLAVSLLSAQALALWPLDEATSWQITLQPYPLLTGIALGLAGFYLVLWLKGGESTASGPGPKGAERGRLLMTATPALGIALLGLGTTFDWPPDLVILAAVLSVVALLGLASVGTFEGLGGRALSYTMVAVGVVVLPTAAQVTYVELGGLGGPGLSGLWPAFLIAGVAALAAALLADRVSESLMPPVAAGGLVAVVAGLCAVRFLLPATDGPALIIPFVLLAVGTAAALASVLRPSGAGTALFGLSLFFPGVLAGFLLGSGIQFTRLKEADTPQGLVDAFVSALHLWALIGGVLVVAVIVLGAVLARRSPVPETGRASGAKAGTAAGMTSETDPKAVADAASPVAPAPAETTATSAPKTDAVAAAMTEALPVVKPGTTAAKTGAESDDPDGSDTSPVVPSPMASPEDSIGDRPAGA